jgi:hypothetical protein
MSNLIIPPLTLAQLRRRDPAAWQIIQDQIRSMLANRAPIFTKAMRQLGREGTHELFERALSSGYLRFADCPFGANCFVMLIYLRSKDVYHVLSPNDKFDLVEELAHV